MPLPIIANVIRTAFNWIDISSGATAVNVLHFRQGDDDPVALNTSINNHLTDGMWALQSNEAKLHSISYTVLATALGPSMEIPVTSTHNIGGGGLDYTPEHCAVVKLGTGLRGRSFRGRIFLPWVAESVQTKGHMNPTENATATVAWAAFLNAMETDGMDLGVASYKLSTFSFASTIQVEPWAAVQRRRQSRLR